MIRDENQVLEPVRKQEDADELSEHLRTAIESPSGFNFDEIRVFYNTESTVSLSVLAHIQGADLLAAPWQWRRWLHEVGYVVQQRQGRVPPGSMTAGRDAK